MSSGKRFTYILVAVMLMLFGGLGILLASKPVEKIDTYDECIQAGGAILETYPEQCVSPIDSQTYKNPDQVLDSLQQIPTN